MEEHPYAFAGMCAGSALIALLVAWTGLRRFVLLPLIDPVIWPTDAVCNFQTGKDPEGRPLGVQQQESERLAPTFLAPTTPGNLTLCPIHYCFVPTVTS
jgi:hypothetical protein